MTTTINKRAIPPPREAPNRQAIEALATATNELSGAIGDAMQRAVRVCELVDAGILALMPNGQLGRNESVDDLGIIDIDDVTGLTAALAGKVSKAGDTMTGQLFQNTTYSLYGYGGNSGSEQGFIGGWDNAGIWRQWVAGGDHSVFVEALLSYSGGLKVDHSANGRIFDLNASGNLRVHTVSVGGDTDILLYEGSANQLNIRTGPAGAYKYSGFQADGSFSAQGLLWANIGSGEAVRVGDDASLWDVNVQHILGVKSQSDAARGGIKFGDGPVLERGSTTRLSLSGGLDATDTIQSKGGNAMLAFDDRALAATWGWYASGGVARLWHSSGVDQIWVSNRDLFVGAAIYPGGPGTCYFYRSSSDRLGVSQNLSVLGWLDAGNMTAAGYQVWSNGYHAPRIQGYCAYPSGSDWNNALENGWWMGADLANAPATGWMKGMVTAHNAAWIEQEVHAFTDNTTSPRRWRRQRLNGTWTAWQRIPSVFVQSTDPGAVAQDGDLWFW